MATSTSRKANGFNQEFVGQVPEDYYCKNCEQVAREPNITTCCGETFCKQCIELSLKDRYPCPSCHDIDYNTTPQNKYKKMIMGLQICCSLKENGCQWTGKLQELEDHLDESSGDCGYIEVDCPRDCGQKVQKREKEKHLSDECPKRSFKCQHCNFEATFAEVNEHYNTCKYYILNCPNMCGAAFERDVLEEHIKMCTLQKMECEFHYAGCTAQFIRSERDDHMSQNMERHLSLMAANSQKVNKDLDRVLKCVERLETQLTEQRADFHEHIREKDRQLTEIGDKITSNKLRIKVGIPPYNFTLENFEKLKKAGEFFETQVLYTHPGGYRFIIRIYPNGLSNGAGTHVSARVYTTHKELQSCASQFTITLLLLNLFRQTTNYYSKEIHCKVTEETLGSSTYDVGKDNKFIAHSELSWNPTKQRCFLQDNTLEFRVTKIVIH